MTEYDTQLTDDTIALYQEKSIKVKISLFEYLTTHNPILITKFAGNTEDLKKISPFTRKYYTWKCDTHECLNTFEAIPNNVFKREAARKYCIICSRKNQIINAQISILKRSGILQNKFPFIIDIWSDKNKKNPNDFSPGSNEKVYLKCPNISTKHSDYEIVVNKIQDHNRFRCSNCITKTSNAEMRIYSELKYTFNNVIWQQKIQGREADITIEDLKLVIEVDGFPWHKEKNKKDLEKNAIFEKNGYTVLRIRDARLDNILCNNLICNIINLSIIEYNKIINWINIYFKHSINVYDEWKNSNYYTELQQSKMYVKYEESIEYLFPESIGLWDYEKNYPFIPSQYSQGSDVESYLKCSNGHTWKRKISHLFRIIKDKKHIMKCPECNKPKSNKRNIQINGISYNSISECCRQLKIDRNKLYKIKGNDVQKQIEEILKSST